MPLRYPTKFSGNTHLSFLVLVLIVQDTPSNILKVLHKARERLDFFEDGLIISLVQYPLLLAIKICLILLVQIELLIDYMLESAACFAIPVKLLGNFLLLKYILALSEHQDIDMMHFTGSTRAGVAVAIASAPTVKRVAQELGGKSANIILDDADIEKAAGAGANHCFMNTGQSCNAPTRMLVSSKNYDRAVEAAAEVANSTVVGSPEDEGVKIGPISNKVQYEKVQRLIQIGIDEGARLVAGGLGRPEGLSEGYFVKPTVFADVTNDMTIAREEIFGPVLSILKYESEDEAIEIANDTEYGLAGYVQSGDENHAKQVARRIRAGQISINGGARGPAAPFGGFKTSGNGREHGISGLMECLETKAIIGN